VTIGINGLAFPAKPLMCVTESAFGNDMMHASRTILPRHRWEEVLWPKVDAELLCAGEQRALAFGGDKAAGAATIDGISPPSNPRGVTAGDGSDGRESATEVDDCAGWLHAASNCENGNDEQHKSCDNRECEKVRFPQQCRNG
jgi:hypothetical protein